MVIDVLIKGAGEVASGVAYLLFSKDLNIVMTEKPEPTMQRRTVSFAEAVFSGKTEVEGTEAQRAECMGDVCEIIKSNKIPVIVNPEEEILKKFNPRILVEGTMTKKNLGTSKNDAELVIGLGPGFKAGEDVDIVIETIDGPATGKIIREGKPRANTGIPCSIEGYTRERVIRSPSNGLFESRKTIGDSLEKGEVVGKVNEEDIHAGISGSVRGLIKSGLEVTEGQKLGDIDPRGLQKFGISDRSLKIAKGVWKSIRGYSDVKL